MFVNGDLEVILNHTKHLLSSVVQPFVSLPHLGFLFSNNHPMLVVEHNHNMCIVFKDFVTSSRMGRPGDICAH